MVNTVKKFLIMLNDLLQIQLKPHQKEHFKTAEGNGDLIGNKIADKITRASKTSPKIIQKRMKKKYLEKIYITRTKTKNYWSVKMKGRKFLMT